MSGSESSEIWDGVKEEFPVKDHLVYFNHAAVSPLSSTTKDSLDALSGLLCSKGLLAEEEIFGRVADVRSSAASLIGAGADEIAFVKNTTQGVLIAAGGIRWNEGDNVVMPAIEFPANVYPWMGLWRRGVELRMVEPDGGTVTAEMLADVCDARTRAVTVSWVQFSSGHRIDVAELGDFCRGRGIYLHVDAIQGLGALEMDVRGSKIDFLSAGGHKWMLALPGTGIFYCRRELLGELDVPNPGWTGVVDHRNFLDYDFRYRDEASRFEEGSLNLHGIYALGVSIDRIAGIGGAAVERRILELTGYVASGLEREGFRIKSPFGEGERSGIISFDSEEGDMQEIYDRLVGAGITCSLREDAVRLSPHMYNTFEECDIVIETASGR
jgi:cysteine desulfurase/selenocysteine lyase